MLTFLRRIVYAFLYDEAAFQRWSATALIAIGDIVEKGGALPGTATVLPLPDLGGWLYVIGPAFRYFGLALLAGSGTSVTQPTIDKPVGTGTTQRIVELERQIDARRTALKGGNTTRGDG